VSDLDLAASYRLRPDLRLVLHGTTVAEYVVEPEIDQRFGPRPYLHPVRTLGGVVVTDVLPADHRWHLGVSVAMPDVSGTNLWGGRTYRRDSGYRWRNDHGRIVPDGWRWRHATGFAQRLRWLDPRGRTLLIEQRTVEAVPLPDRADVWRLDFAFTLTAPADRSVVLGSPATNGRPGGAGYGGFFWRAAPGDHATFTAGAEGEERLNGSAQPWLALAGTDVRGRAYTLVFTGLGADDRWFVRTGIYPGVCAALAFEHPRRLAAGQELRRRHHVYVADGWWSRHRVAELL
jgi:hypothetical protein